MKKEPQCIFAVHRRNEIGQDVVQCLGAGDDPGFRAAHAEAFDNVPDAIRHGTDLIHRELIDPNWGERDDVWRLAPETVRHRCKVDKLCTSLTHRVLSAKLRRRNRRPFEHDAARSMLPQQGETHRGGPSSTPAQPPLQSSKRLLAESASHPRPAGRPWFAGSSCRCGWFLGGAALPE